METPTTMAMVAVMVAVVMAVVEEEEVWVMVVWRVGALYRWS